MKLKCAFVKQVYDIFGAWWSFTYDPKNIALPLERWPYKATFWEMTCLLDADWYVMPFLHDSHHVRNVAFQNPDRPKLFEKHTRPITKPSSFPVDEYDLVISLEPILRPHRPSPCVFAYFHNEHKDSHYGFSLQSPLPGYDLFLDHMMNAPTQFHGLSSSVALPYMRNPDAVRQLIPRENPRGVWMDARTVLHLAQGNARIVWTQESDSFLEKTSAELGIPVKSKRTIYQNFYAMSDPPQWEDAKEYLKEISACEYFLSIAPGGSAQSICDGAALGLICLGAYDLLYHRMVCHPSCLFDKPEDALAKIKELEAQPSLKKEILEYQEKNLRHNFIEQPMQLLHQAVEIKRRRFRSCRTRLPGIAPCSWNTEEDSYTNSLLSPVASMINAHQMAEDPNATNVSHLLNEDQKLNPSTQKREKLRIYNQCLWLAPNSDGVKHLKKYLLAETHSEAEYLDILHEEMPELADLLAGQHWLEAARHVREWVTRTLVWSQDKNLLRETDDMLENFRCYALHKGAAWCAASAKFYAWTLRLLGIPTIEYSYAYKERFHPISHVTNIIWAPHGLKPSFYIMDAYMNYEYVDASTDEPIEFFDLLKRIRDERISSIKKLQNEYKRWMIHPPEMQLEEFFDGLSDEERQTKMFTPEGNAAYLVNLNLNRMKAWMNALNEFRGETEAERFLLSTIGSNACLTSSGNPYVDTVFAQHFKTWKQKS